VDKSKYSRLYGFFGFLAVFAFVLPADDPWRWAWLLWLTWFSFFFRKTEGEPATS
jgi:hypothetical protein